MNDNKPGEPTNQNPYESAPAPKSSCGCCAWGCLAMFFLGVLVVVGGGFGTYWWIQGQVNRYTADAPAELPVVELPEEELAEVENRIETFQETIEAGETPDDLVLTAEELNALLTKDEEMRGKVHVDIEDGEVTGDISIPVDFLPGGTGRYFNASATFNVSLENGVLIVTLKDADVKGEKLPQQFLDAMGQENLAKDVYKDPEVAATLSRIESISIEHDRIILKPRVMTNGQDDGPDLPTSDQPLTGDSPSSEEATQPDELRNGEAPPSNPADLQAEPATEAN